MFKTPETPCVEDDKSEEFRNGAQAGRTWMLDWICTQAENNPKATMEELLDWLCSPAL